MNILVIIPARGGSKGIPRKNLRSLCGKPLIYYSIKNALSSRFKPDVYVSSEDNEILSIAKKLGAKTIQRENRDSEDVTTLDPVIYKGWQKAEISERKIYDIVVTLQPTSPIRLPGTLDQCLAEYQKYKPFILATGYQCKIQEFGVNNNLPRQQIDGFFYDDGNIYIHSPQALQQKAWSARDAYKYFTNEIENYEIDTEVDLKVVGYLLAQLRG